MRKLFENAISNIEELVLLRKTQIDLLEQLHRTKDITSLNYKLKYYKIWINLLRNCIENNVKIHTKSDIIKLTLTKSLEKNLIELFETNNIQDINKTKNEINILKQDLSMIKSDESSLKQIDTTKIEAQPKILADEIRPTDDRGAAIFDMRYLYGVGPKTAIKLVDYGITLNKLLNEWNTWVSSNVNNAILMPSKLPIPIGYTNMQWAMQSEDKQRSIQMAIINNRLNKETKYLKKLNNHQLLGVKYFHDMSKKIPRNEVQRAEKILTATAKHMNKDIVITLCGSYRRGCQKSGDVDCLITHRDIKTNVDLDNNPINILAKFVELLTNIDFLVDHLTDFGYSKYMGFCIINNSDKHNIVARRIDIRFIPFNSYGAAILYFTGSKTFNTQMRSYALTKGYSLNEYGLKQLKDNVLIPCKTEEEVFTILKYPYKTPEERNI